MSDPVIPAAATIAAFVMTVASWYNMMRTSIQLIHDDIQAHKTADQDIARMFTDVELQQSAFDDWRRRWLIFNTTPNAVLLEFWGEHRLDLICQRLQQIKYSFGKTREHLGGFAELKKEEWQRVGKFRRNYLREKFIMLKKSYVQKLIDQFPKDMTAIIREADAGWKEQLLRLTREIAKPTEYHALAAYSLVRIAKQSQRDVEALLHCCAQVRNNFIIVLDLDIFAAALASVEKDVPQIGEVLTAGHLKVEVLVREANEPDAQLVRLEVERSPRNVSLEARIVDAFKAIIGDQRRLVYFSHDHSTVFGLRKTNRPGGPFSKLRLSVVDILARQVLPVYDEARQRFANRVPILDELSTYRAAFELAQACLLFLRTSWFAGICRCGIRCESCSETESQGRHQFGLETTHITHRAPLWKDSLGSIIEGQLADSWCTTDFQWNTLNKPLRHLGLLLVEFALETIVIPNTDNTPGAAEIVHLLILTDGGDNGSEWKWFERDQILRLVRLAFPRSPRFADPIEWCLTQSFPPSPTDEVWESQLRRFYFRVVKPLRDIYDTKLHSGVLAA